MLEKDKKCIEISMRSMMLTHRPYQEDTEIEITGMVPGRNIICENNPFDIPCNVVIVPKRYFERLQVENEELKKKLSEFEPIPGYREFLTALYPWEDVEKLVWITSQLCCGRDLRHALQTDLEYYKSVSSVQAKSICCWKEATGCNTPEEAEKKIESLKGALRKCNSIMLKELDQEIDTWQKATGCNSPEEVM